LILIDLGFKCESTENIICDSTVKFTTKYSPP